MQKVRILNTAIIVSVLALAACSGEPEVITVNRFDPQAEALKNAGPVKAPPMIQANRTYRCSDNSLFFVDFYTDNTALVRTERGADPVASLTAAAGNPPYVAEGYSVSGSGENVRITAPGKNNLACHT